MALWPRPADDFDGHDPYAGVVPATPLTHSPSPDLPTIAVGALGGTIAMTPDAVGGPVTPSLDAHDLVAAAPVLDQLATISATSLCGKGSPSITMADVRAAYEFADRAVREGAAGVVLTHGTDTLEETAFLLDLCWPHDAPLVVTGAMRAPEAAGADGPANLYAAVLTATSEQARGQGVLVVLDDTIHAARFVAKTDSSAVSTFQSPGWGPLGRVIEGEARFVYATARPEGALSMPASDEPVAIPVLEAGLADDGWAFDAVIARRPRAIVLSGSGGGHVSAELGDKVAAAVAAGVPVIIATRAASGPTLRHSYGYPGADAWLVERGVIMAGWLSARKARLLAHVVLAAGADRERLAAEFAVRGA